jgi:endonuclease-3 related protein
MDNQALGQILPDIYRRLLARYGLQHWWPAEAPFEVIVGAILTQSAAWGNVEKAIASLKKANALSPKALRRLPTPRLAHLVHPCGYYNAKARKLKSFADWLGSRYDDDLKRLFAGGVEDLRPQLLSIHGIGEETADSIILYAAGKPVFVIDAYTRRIISRLGLAPAQDSYDTYQALFMQNLSPDARMFNEYHALFVRLGKDVCRPRPLCPRCCLNAICQFGRNPSP